jgi:23S rRNA (uracil1939-C5)-methyltransferase
MEVEVEISRLGARGDAVVEGPEGPIFTPFTLPGERVRVSVDREGDHARLLDVLLPSADRVTPVCPHFGVCGGCALQHMEIQAYLRWKRDQVVAALRSRGLDAEVEGVRPVPLGSRRRASLAIARGATGPALRYHRGRSHELIDVEVCPVLSPRIVAALPKIREALATWLGGKREAKVSITETDSGLDLVVEGAKAAPALMAAFARQALALGVARLTVEGESITTSDTPEIKLSGVKVRLPPGPFLQASREAETAMVDLVCDGVGRANRVADLFAGLGTFTFALARTAAVDAFEADETALAALVEAARKTPKLKPIRTFTRDLFRSSLRPKELMDYHAVVFDPPRAEASGQGAGCLKRADARRGFLQSRNAGARSPHPRGRWLPHRPHCASGSVPVLAAYRGRRAS